MKIFNNPEYNLLKGKRILVCEDHPVNLRMTGRILENVNIEYTAATNGREAVSIFSASEEGYYDLIIMDIHIPVISGTEAVSIIRLMDRADSKTVPVIAVSGDISDDNLNDYSEAGINAFIEKPIDPEILYSLLQRYMVE